MFDSNTNRVGEFDFSFDILSLNVRGIRNDTKRNKIFNWLKNHTSNQAVVFLQETHSTSDVENLWSNQWQFKEKIIFSHGEHNAQGTLIAFRENLVYKLEDKIIDDGGRYIILKCIIQDSPFLLVNLCNSNNENEQVQIIEKVTLAIENIDANHSYNVVMGGDFNFIQDTVYDSDGGSPTLKMSSITELSQLKNSRDLVYIWHIRNPFTKRFTYRQHNPLIRKRSDYFLISDSLQDHTKYVDIDPAINTDHSAIVLNFSYIKQTERGPSYWKFNNSLLSDNVYLNMMKGKMDEFISANHLPDDPRSSWDFLKFKIK